MARSDLIRRLFRSHVAQDDASFFKAATELIAEERRLNHKAVATELEHALLGHHKPGARDSIGLGQLPTSRDERPLLRVLKPDHELDELVLSDAAQGAVQEIVREHWGRSALASYNLRPRRRLLLIGPPGTGKSATAGAIASALSLPIVRASLAALASSYLGDTARNIEAIVRFAERVPCVLLFDEFDVLGQERGQAGDHGEMRRVVASVLQLLEDMDGESLVIATSNHPGQLDTAIWRRFDELVRFEALDRSQLELLIELRLRTMPSRISPAEWSGRLLKFSPAEVEMVCFDAIRLAALAGDQSVDDEQMAIAAERMRWRRKAMTESST